MKNIAGRISAVWALLLFGITMIPVGLVMWAIGLWPEPKRTAMFHAISLSWMKFFFFFTGCRIVVIGTEHFKKGRNYIVTCNHRTMMDVPVATPFIPGTNKTIAKIELSRIPLFGLIYKRGSVLVDRKDEDSRKESFTQMKKVLEQGMHMCIYPEGTRNKSSRPLNEFKDGAFRLAAETGVPIIPAILFNTNKVMPNNKAFYFWPSKMEIHFLPPVEAEVNDRAAIKELKAKVFTQMEAYIIRHSDKLR